MTKDEWDDELFTMALEAGCNPFWADGIFGPAWHCGCEKRLHGFDSQCSMITVDSLRRVKSERVPVVDALSAREFLWKKHGDHAILDTYTGDELIEFAEAYADYQQEKNDS